MNIPLPPVDDDDDWWRTSDSALHRNKVRPCVDVFDGQFMWGNGDSSGIRACVQFLGFLQKTRLNISAIRIHLNVIQFSQPYRL